MEGGQSVSKQFFLFGILAHHVSKCALKMVSQHCSLTHRLMMFLNTS